MFDPNSEPHSDSDPLIRFYAGTGPDSERRMLVQILAWEDRSLEDVHDYIQWLFPTSQPSAFNPDAPLITEHHKTAFRQQPMLQANLKKSLLRMLQFYGLQCVEDGSRVKIEKAVNWNDRKYNWLTPGNHNHLRLTRIMISLGLLGLPNYANALFRSLDDISKSDGQTAISKSTCNYWAQAIADLSGAK